MRVRLKTLQLPGPWTPHRNGLRASRSLCAMRAHNILRPLYLKLLDPALVFSPRSELVINASGVDIGESGRAAFIRA